MSDTGNVFDNSGTITPSLEGQVDVGAIDETTDTDVTPEQEGQVTETQATDPVWKAKFKSPEEMYDAYAKLDQSYANLRPQFTKVTQELSGIKKGSTQVANQAAPDPQNPVEVLLGRVKDIVNPIQEQNDALMMQAQVSRAMQENSDFAELAPAMAEILKAKPHLWNDDSPIETALELARSRKTKDNLSKVATETRAQAYADKDIKIVNTAGANKQTSATEEKSPEDTIRDGILRVSNRGGSIF